MLAPILEVLAGFLSGWCLIGTFVLVTIPAGQWTGVSRWGVIIAWPLAFWSE